MTDAQPYPVIPPSRPININIRRDLPITPPLPVSQERHHCGEGSHYHQDDAQMKATVDDSP